MTVGLWVDPEEEEDWPRCERWMKRWILLDMYNRLINFDIIYLMEE